MYITGNAAVATAVANYRRSLALARMAMANYQVLLNYANDHKRLPPERLRATWRGCITLRNQLQANADAALAVGGHHMERTPSRLPHITARAAPSGAALSMLIFSRERGARPR